MRRELIHSVFGRLGADLNVHQGSFLSNDRARLESLGYADLTLNFACLSRYCVVWSSTTHSF